jgi:hypothetical protein
VLGWISALIHGIYIHKSGNYLKKNYPDIWKDFEPKSVLGISTKYTEGRNYFKKIGFYFSKHNLSDGRILSYKRKVKSSLFITAILMVLAIFSLILKP